VVDGSKRRARAVTRSPRNPLGSIACSLGSGCRNNMSGKHCAEGYRYGGRKSRPVELIAPKAFNTVREVEQAIVKLTRRLDEVRALDPTQVRHNDPGQFRRAPCLADP
jgi:hypothetical protein